jgi:hypothetical protein
LNEGCAKLSQQLIVHVSSTTIISNRSRGKANEVDRITFPADLRLIEFADLLASPGANLGKDLLVQRWINGHGPHARERCPAGDDLSWRDVRPPSPVPPGQASALTVPIMPLSSCSKMWQW